MTDQEYNLITKFLQVRFRSTIIIAGLMVASLIFLGFILKGPDTNDTLAALLGGIIASLSFTLKEVGTSLARNISSFLNKRED